jgi:hypothetical protein
MKKLYFKRIKINWLNVFLIFIFTLIFGNLSIYYLSISLDGIFYNYISYVENSIILLLGLSYLLSNLSFIEEERVYLKEEIKVVVK